MRQHLITYMIHRLKQLLSIDWGLDLGIFVGDGTNGDCSKGGGVGILVVFSKPVPLVGLSAVVVVAGVVACFSEGCCGDKSHRGILDAGSPVSSIDSKCPSIGEDIV